MTIVPYDKDYFDQYLKLHRKRVSDILGYVIRDLFHRSMAHDTVLMKEPLHDQLTRIWPLLHKGSISETDPEVRAILNKLNSSSDYHPAFHKDDFMGMTLIQYVEWLADFKAECAQDGVDPLTELSRRNDIPLDIRHILINTLEDWRQIN